MSDEYVTSAENRLTLKIIIVVSYEEQWSRSEDFEHISSEGQLST